MIINNVNLVLEDEVINGSLEVQDGRISAFAESQSRLAEAIDGEGGWLLPGLIELHTDNLDKFFTPRPKVDWPAHSAMSSHDALMVASGITTVLDAVAIGDVRDGGDRLENLEKMINAVEETQKRGLNRAEHRLHLRCELPHHTTLPLFEKLVGREPVSMVSLMDHSPGQRQYADRSKYRDYYQGKYHLTNEEMDKFEEEQMALAAAWSQPNRQRIAAICRERNIALASHDDATCEHVLESRQLGSVIAEFPTTIAAAQASRQHGMNVLMGAPNIVRGGSHSGNVAAHHLAASGLLDILSSDYYPASLLAALRQREHPQLLVAHRYITRPHNAGCENHIALSEHEFFTRAEQHLFALSWHANNNYYGIGIEIDLWLHAGFDVVANGSRAHLPQEHARYADALLPICLQVSPAVLRQRLEQRGRENETEIAQRLARAARYTPNECLMLNNDGRLSQSVDALVSLIRIHGNRREQQTA